MPFKKQPPLYSVWQGMKRRCDNPNFKQYSDYGGRGIKVCPRWLEPNRAGYENFVSDMGPRPPGYTLERINNDGDYSPENCKWASRKEQQRNRRVTRIVTIEGVEYVAKDLSDQSGLKTDTIVNRAIQGLSYDEVMSPEQRVFAEGLALGGAANGARQRAKTHCKNGHEYNEKNTYITKEGWRNCRRCKADKQFLRNKSHNSP